MDYDSINIWTGLFIPSHRVSFTRQRFLNEKTSLIAFKTDARFIDKETHWILKGKLKFNNESIDYWLKCYLHGGWVIKADWLFLII